MERKTMDKKKYIVPEVEFSVLEQELDERGCICTGFGGFGSKRYDFEVESIIQDLEDEDDEIDYSNSDSGPYYID